MTSELIKPIAITIGEPAGIGPELVVQLLQTSWLVPLVIIGNRALLQQAAGTIKLSFKDYPNYDPAQEAPISLIDLPLTVPVVAGQLDKANASFVIAMLERASQGALNKEFSAIVTAPVHKGILNEAGIAFRGHTEFFGEQSKTSSLMLFMNDKLKLALVTTHLPLKAVPDAITKQRLTEVLTILHKALIKEFLIETPRIGVCGLNPHAGEGGHLGREELDVIIPCLDQLRKGDLKMNLIGPLPADTIFLPERLTAFDAIVAMYHDQGLSVMKQMNFSKTVNITLGLPFVRTSVDHGTALDIAGKGIADVCNLKSALGAAILLASPIEA